MSATCEMSAADPNLRAVTTPWPSYLERPSASRQERELQAYLREEFPLGDGPGRLARVLDGVRRRLGRGGPRPR